MNEQKLTYVSRYVVPFYYEKRNGKDSESLIDAEDYKLLRQDF